MANINSFLDKIFMEGAKKKEAAQIGKIFLYKLYTNIYMEEIKSIGKCKIVSRTYDRKIDCDILTCKDIDTEERFSCNQFEIELSNV